MSDCDEALSLTVSPSSSYVTPAALQPSSIQGSTFLSVHNYLPCKYETCRDCRIAAAAFSLHASSLKEDVMRKTCPTGKLCRLGGIVGCQCMLLAHGMHLCHEDIL